MKSSSTPNTQTSVSDKPHDSVASIPAVWQIAIQSILRGDERVLAFVELDLDSRNHFAQTLVVLTNSRIIECRLISDTVAPPSFWEIPKKGELHSSIYAGLGKLELLSGEQVVSKWSFTTACESRVDRFVASFAAVTRNRALAANDSVVARCASCGAAFGRSTVLHNLRTGCGSVSFQIAPAFNAFR